MLIVGGLIVVAVLAIVGAFLLARGGSKAEQPAPAVEQVATPQTQQEAQVQGDKELVNTRPLSQEPAPLTGTPANVTDAPTVSMPVQVDEPLVVTHFADQLQQEVKMLQDHVYQLTEQLQVLNYHTREIEQRLGRIHASLPRQETVAQAQEPQLPFPEARKF